MGAGCTILSPSQPPQHVDSLGMVGPRLEWRCSQLGRHKNVCMCTNTHTHTLLLSIGALPVLDFQEVNKWGPSSLLAMQVHLCVYPI